VVLWKALLIGLCWGTAVSIGNHYYLQWTLKKNKQRPPQEATQAVINCFLTRYFINLLAIFLVFYFGHEIWMLVGTGLGLIVMKNVNMVREYRESRKHPWKKKNKTFR